MHGTESRARGPGARLRATFTERLGYKGAAIFFALVLWVIVRTEEPTEVGVPVRIVATHDDARTLAGKLPAVQALVSGRAREVLKLFDTPLVLRRVIPADAPDSVRFELRPSDVTRPPGVEVSVIDVQPRTITLAFDVSAERLVPVVSRLQLSVDTSLRFLGEARIEPDSVTVTGLRRDLERIFSVGTAAMTIVLTDTTRREIPLDTSNLGVHVRPRSVYLRWFPRAPLPSIDSTPGRP